MEPNPAIGLDPEEYETASRASRLNGWTALIIFLAYVAAQLVSGLVVVAVMGAWYFIDGQDLHDPAVREAFSRAALVPTAVFGMIASILVVVSLTLRMAPAAVTDRSEKGIAWCQGDSRMLWVGIVIGASFAFTFLPLIGWLFPPDPDMTLGPVAEMASQPGLGRWTWLCLAILVAPPAEEFVFRGVLLAGFVRSRGPVVGSILTTLVFTAMHAGEAIHYWPAFLGIGGLAVLTLALRLLSRSLGPAIAAHLGYNLVIAAAAFAVPG